MLVYVSVRKYVPVCVSLYMYYMRFAYSILFTRLYSKMLSKPIIMLCTRLYANDLKIYILVQYNCICDYVCMCI